MRLALPSNAVRSATGMIQSAPVSFTTVRTSSACGPNSAAAPTTELVSWMARADQRPNWACVKRMGNSNYLGEEQRHRVQREYVSDGDSQFVLVRFAMAAIAVMALPPQIAVPPVIRNAAFDRT